MDREIHYYGIGFLARAAGFTKQHALTIAYASQYVDNSTESAPIRVGNIFFDPVRSAHYGLKVFDWAIQKKVYIPFHFIPAHPFDPSSETYSFVTERNSQFANMIFREACRKTADETLRLVRIGISLHTLADSWAHQGFSGREDAINDVESIQLFRDGSWKHLFFENIYLDILPQVGHAQAGYYPDHPSLRWKYTRAATDKRKEVERNNLEEFLHAVETIHRLLTAVKKSEAAPALAWKDIKSQIQTLLSDPEPNLKKRCEKWRDLYQASFGDASGYQYDKYAWRDEALKPKKRGDIEWDNFRQSEFERLSFSMTPGFYETPWVKFHQAALRQRNFVLEHLL